MAYVKVEELRERLYDSDTITFKGLAIIDNFPTADVEEVKHGYWKEYHSYGAYHYDCSNCDDGFAMQERCKNVPNYCSNCGAKMDGGVMHDG